MVVSVWLPREQSLGPEVEGRWLTWEVTPEARVRGGRTGSHVQGGVWEDPAGELELSAVEMSERRQGAFQNLLRWHRGPDRSSTGSGRPLEGGWPWRPWLPSLPTLRDCVCYMATDPAHRESPTRAVGGRDGTQGLVNHTRNPPRGCPETLGDFLKGWGLVLAGERKS